MECCVVAELSGAERGWSLIIEGRAPRERPLESTVTCMGYPSRYPSNHTADTTVHKPTRGGLHEAPVCADVLESGRVRRRCICCGVYLYCDRYIRALGTTNTQSLQYLYATPAYNSHEPILAFIYLKTRAKKVCVGVFDWKTDHMKRQEKTELKCQYLAIA